MNSELEKLNSQEEIDSDKEMNSKDDLEKEKEKEEERVKSLNIKKLSNKEIIIKSIKISLKNWRQSLYDQFTLLIGQIFSIYLPISKAELIDSCASSKNYEEIYKSFKKYITLLVIKNIINLILDLFEYYVIRKHTQKYRTTLLDKIIEKDIFFFDIFKTGEIIEKINIAEGNMEEDFICKTISLIQNIIKLLFMAYYLYKTSFKLSIVFLAILLCRLGSDYLFDKFYYDTSILLKMDEKYCNELNQLISNIRMIKSFGKEKDEVEKLKEYKIKYSFDLNLESIFLNKLNKLIEKASEGVNLLYVGKYILEKKFTIGKFTVFKQYQEEFIDCYNDIKNTLQDYRKLLLNWKIFFEIYDFPVKIKSLKNYIPKIFKGKIKFDNVSFAYPIKPDTNILQNLSFEIKPGKIFAICGSSGSGKTSISNVLQRLYDINGGFIYLDDINIKDYDLKYLRDIFGFVAQEPILSNGTIEQNILYGVHNYKKGDFEEIIKLCNIDKFVNDKNLFPEGLKTLVGERGNQISGGQKQRIAIARALMKNCKILIFDEATSAMDAQNESEIQNEINNIAKKRGITTIIISHRLSTIINADTIIVLNNGKVVECGNHNNLIEKDGEYKKLFQKQLFCEEK